jgi:hypothetical protein
VMLALVILALFAVIKTMSSSVKSSLSTSNSAISSAAS